MKAYPSVAEAQRRLNILFPRPGFDTAMNGPMAARAVVAMLYVDAVVPDEGDLPDGTTWARPATVLWLNESVLTQRGAEADRLAWAAAAAGQRKGLVALVTSWGLASEGWYRDTSREPLRDETWPKLRGHAAVRTRPGVATTSSHGRWALTESFADLFDPALTGDDVDQAITTWSEAHLSPTALRRTKLLSREATSAVSVPVTLPDGTVRRLEPTESSALLVGVVEQWAPARLHRPTVLAISEPGAKVYTADAAYLADLGIQIDVSNVLPDALLADVGETGGVTFWAVEVVSSDGEIDEERKDALAEWARQQGIDPTDMRYLTVFVSRTARPARKRLSDLAAGTYAWFLDEPDRELAWYELGSTPS